MDKSKGHWIWNVVLVIAVLLCITAFTLHYKNWTSAKPTKFQVISGFYKRDFNYADLDSVVFVERLPPMIRLNGFSAFDKGKGIYRQFKDSLTDKEVPVFIDNFSQQKIKLVQKDSAQFFINLKDSVETEQLYEFFTSKLEGQKGLGAVK